MWHEINSQGDLDSFMNMLWHFHDSCLKELKYISGAYVKNDLAMWPINEKRSLRVIFQRQAKKSSVIEVEFLGLKRLSMIPADEKYTCEILGATMLLKKDCIYWCDENGLTEADFHTYEGTLICATKARWRVIDGYIGKEQVYVMR